MPQGLFRLAEIVARLGGELIGDPDVLVQRVGALRSSGPGDIAFLAHPKYRKELGETRAGAVVVAPSDRDATAIPRIVCRDPYAYFAWVSALFHPLPAVVPGVDPTAVVSP